MAKRKKLVRLLAVHKMGVKVFVSGKYLCFEVTGVSFNAPVTLNFTTTAGQTTEQIPAGAYNQDGVQRIGNSIVGKFDISLLNSDGIIGLTTGLFQLEAIQGANKASSSFKAPNLLQVVYAGSTWEIQNIVGAKVYSNESDLPVANAGIFSGSGRLLIIGDATVIEFTPFNNDIEKICGQVTTDLSVLYIVGCANLNIVDIRIKGATPAAGKLGLGFVNNSITTAILDSILETWDLAGANGCNMFLGCDPKTYPSAWGLVHKVNLGNRNCNVVTN
jgi:hypothetical protein